MARLAISQCWEFYYSLVAFFGEDTSPGLKNSRCAVDKCANRDWPPFCAMGRREYNVQKMKQSVTQLSKQARAVIQIAGAVLLVFGIEAITNGALFRAGLLLPVGGFLFGRSLSA